MSAPPSESEQAAKLRVMQQLQEEALGPARRDRISTDEIGGQNRVKIDLDALDTLKRSAKPGTAEYKLAQKYKSSIALWKNARLEGLVEADEDALELDSMNSGQTHRLALNAKLTTNTNCGSSNPPVKYSTSRGGLRGSGRGGGFAGARGRGRGGHQTAMSGNELSNFQEALRLKGLSITTNTSSNNSPSISRGGIPFNSRPVRAGAAIYSPGEMLQLRGAHTSTAPGTPRRRPGESPAGWSKNLSSDPSSFISAVEGNWVKSSKSAVPAPKLSHPQLIVKSSNSNAEPSPKLLEPISMKATPVIPTASKAMTVRATAAEEVTSAHSQSGVQLSEAPAEHLHAASKHVGGSAKFSIEVPNVSQPPASAVQIEETSAMPQSDNTVPPPETEQTFAQTRAPFEPAIEEGQQVEIIDQPSAQDATLFSLNEHNLSRSQDSSSVVEPDEALILQSANLIDLEGLDFEPDTTGTKTSEPLENVDAMDNHTSKVGELISALGRFSPEDLEDIFGQILESRRKAIFTEPSQDLPTAVQDKLESKEIRVNQDEDMAKEVEQVTGRIAAMRLTPEGKGSVRTDQHMPGDKLSQGAGAKSDDVLKDMPIAAADDPSLAGTDTSPKASINTGLTKAHQTVLKVGDKGVVGSKWATSSSSPQVPGAPQPEAEQVIVHHQATESASRVGANDVFTFRGASKAPGSEALIPRSTKEYVGTNNLPSTAAVVKVGSKDFLTSKWANMNGPEETSLPHPTKEPVRVDDLPLGTSASSGIKSSVKGTTELAKTISQVSNDEQLTSPTSPRSSASSKMFSLGPLQGTLTESIHARQSKPNSGQSALASYEKQAPAPSAFAGNLANTKEGQQPLSHRSPNKPHLQESASNEQRPMLAARYLANLRSDLRKENVVRIEDFVKRTQAASRRQAQR
ncbi:MAG: hypothetical protein M1819_006005 [Sarea resinae]|nr:MAG: hypothetical protein M1819_006005 [Sarea resinae]